MGETRKARLTLRSAGSALLLVGAGSVLTQVDASAHGVKSKT